MSFEDRLAHKLYRRYSKDEAVAFLKGKLDEAAAEIADLRTQVGKLTVIYEAKAGAVDFWRNRSARFYENLRKTNGLLEEARSKLAHEKREERKAFRETEASKKARALQQERRQLRDERNMWRDRYAELANTLLDGDVEGAKRKAAMIIRPDEPAKGPESAFTSNWRDELLHDIGIYIKKTFNPKKK